MESDNMKMEEDDGVHLEFPVDTCGNNLIPSSLKHTSLEGGLDDDHVTCAYDRYAEMGASDNGDTDYDSNDDDDEEEDESDEDEDEDSSDELQALADHLGVRFRDLVSSKISDAEKFFDDPTFLPRPLSAFVKTPCAPATHSLPHNPSHQEVSTGLSSKPDAGLGISHQSTHQTIATQTEDSSHRSLNPRIVTAAVVTEDGKPEEVSESEQARLEIRQLRDVRECLITQRQKWAAQLKDDTKSEKDFKTAEYKVFEFEEGIEAIDLAIEFKNEVVLGHPKQEPVISEGPSSDSSEPDLASRLQTLSFQELQRLICTYFGKVVELRSASKKLERELEHSENSNDQLKRRLSGERKYWKKVHSENQARIHLMLSSQKNHSSVVDTYFDEMENQMATYRKRKHDLERSLTELLVRHGYLVNGADYDVKQVVKMLGIESQLNGETGRDPDDKDGNLPGTSKHLSHHSRAKPPLSLRRNARQLEDELPKILRDRLMDGLDREHRKPQKPKSQPPAAEVKRERRRLIIQPSNAAVSSVNGPPLGGQNSHSLHQNLHRPTRSHK